MARLRALWPSTRSPGRPGAAALGAGTVRFAGGPSGGGPTKSRCCQVRQAPPKQQQPGPKSGSLIHVVLMQTDDGVVATTHSETTSGDRGARDEGDGERALGGDARTLDGRLRLGRRRRDDTATQRREPRRRRASGPVALPQMLR